MAKLYATRMLKELILVIDDEKDLQKLLKYNLEKEGYEVLSAETGERGLELAKSKKPSLIILDLMLPGVGGLEVCRTLKADHSSKHIPLVMLTAKNSDVDHVVGLELGAADYLTKPFSVKILLARIKNILKITTPAKDPKAVYESGGVVLDRERHHCTVKKKPLALTKLEFKILLYFMENPDIVLTRDRLASGVWGQGCFVSPTSINMQIKSLRDKLGSCSERIQSVRGIGYRFLPE